jgi:hypothetical protein
VPDPRQVAAWRAEQLRLQRQRLGYWRGIGEAYLQILAFTLFTLAVFSALCHQVGVS